MVIEVGLDRDRGWEEQVEIEEEVFVLKVVDDLREVRQLPFEGRGLEEQSHLLRRIRLRRTCWSLL